MKHILNNLSEEEKNAIREQHTGGMKVMTENFSKLINSKLGDSKPLVNEQREEVDGVLVREITDSMILLTNASSDEIQHILENLTDEIKFIAFINCEGADFSNIDLCSFPTLMYVNLKGTPNNFEENVSCEYDLMGEQMYQML